MKKTKPESIEKKLINELNEFMSQYGVKSINFGSHSLKIKKPIKKTK